MGLQRHIKISEKNGEKPKLTAKLLDYKGKGSERTYRAAVLRPKD
jgi:hypothetical protein